MEEEILKKYFEDKMKQVDIATELNVSKYKVSRVVTKDPRYKTEKERRKESNRKKNREELPLWQASLHISVFSCFCLSLYRIHSTPSAYSIIFTAFQHCASPSFQTGCKFIHIFSNFAEFETNSFL